MLQLDYCDNDVLVTLEVAQVLHPDVGAGTDKLSCCLFRLIFGPRIFRSSNLI
jgi:hypothetical protein